MLDSRLSFLVLFEAFHQRVSSFRRHCIRRLCLRCLLLLEALEVLLVVPHKIRIGGEKQIDILESSSSGFDVECPSGEDCEDVDGAEQVEGLFVELLEDGRKEQDLC